MIRYVKYNTGMMMILKHKKHTVKNKEFSQQDVEEKICVVKRNEKEYNELNEKIEEKLKKLKEFAEQTDD